LRVERVYTGRLDGLRQFSTRWRLAMPTPETSRVSVRGGGIKELMDLRYAEPGGIRLVKAGERPPGYEGLDAMDEKWDSVQAVSDAQVVEFTVGGSEGDLVIELDRGDGVATVLTTPADGWSAVHVKPVIGEHYLELTLEGKPQEDSGDVVRLALPAQLLAARAAPRGEAVADVSESSPAGRELTLTGDGTAVNPVDGAELVWIPAGAFARGSDAEVAGADEQPVREIHLDGYWIYKNPVTVGAYKAHCEAAGTEFKPPWPQGMKAAPEGDENAYAAAVNWFEAGDYARWAGGKLPTEAQWEKAARGTDGREFPWGNDWQPGRCVSMENTLYTFNEGFRPVGSHPEGASPYGVMDMAGGMWEWTRDWYRYEYYGESSDRNPTGPETGANKVVRGGCSLYDWRFSRSAARFVQPPEVDDWTPVGFRVVIEADAEGKLHTNSR
jgi:formylglycine-generating enzyme required for sulfatase activity